MTPSIRVVTLIVVAVALVAVTGPALAETPPPLAAAVDHLVLRHHIHGILYADAHALGPEAIPRLLEILGDPGLEPFWVNTVVTLGFVESSLAREELLSFLLEERGEVEGHAFRALAAVPFALGCIASSGDREALAALEAMVDGTRVYPWSYRTTDVVRLLAQKAVVGLAVSGRVDAVAVLDRLEQDLATGDAPADLRPHLETGRSLLSTLAREGRAAMFN